MIFPRKAAGLPGPACAGPLKSIYRKETSPPAPPEPGQTDAMDKPFVFHQLPQDRAQLLALPESAMTDPFAVAALTVAALCRYGTDRDACFDMLNYLRGPRPLSVYEQQFLRDRLGGKEYKPFSFFAGAVPGNNYTPNEPYTIIISGDENAATRGTDRCPPAARTAPARWTCAARATAPGGCGSSSCCPISAPPSRTTPGRNALSVISFLSQPFPLRRGFFS